MKKLLLIFFVIKKKFIFFKKKFCHDGHKTRVFDFGWDMNNVGLISSVE